MQGRDRPGEVPAPVVTDNDCVPFAEGANHAGDVGGEGWSVVPAGWFVARAVSAQVGCDSVIAGVREGDELVVPRPPELWETVEQQHQRATAGLGDVKADAVGIDVSMRPWPIDEDRRLLDQWPLTRMLAASHDRHD